MPYVIKFITMISLAISALAMIVVGISLDRPATADAAQDHELQRRNEIMNRQMQGMLIQLKQMEERIQDLGSDLAHHRDLSATTTRKSQFDLLSKVTDATHRTITGLLDTAEECNVMVRDYQMVRDYMVRDEMDRLRLHLNTVTTQMHDAVRSLEHLRDMLAYENDTPAPASQRGPLPMSNLESGPRPQSRSSPPG